MTQQFKKGQRVVLVCEDGPIYKGVVIRYEKSGKYANSYYIKWDEDDRCLYAETNEDNTLIDEEAYNSPLYKVLHES
jgi:hypothetical protein